jgi:pyridinium-3,5-biscarboxylic acid mononucleotide synthase
MTDDDFVPDLRRAARIGLPEAILCLDKTAEQISSILAAARDRLLLTRLDGAKFYSLPPGAREHLDYDAVSRTAVLGGMPAAAGPARVAVVTAGTSDLSAALEAVRTLRFHGQEVLRVADVGVAGLWRLLARVEDLRNFPVLIAAAGMDAALPSVLGGLVPGAVIALPTSVGYGVAAGGRTALHAALASCAPGVTVVNIDNGYGAACAALRILGTSAG